MLLTHLSGVFSRAVLQEEDLTNPILERIMNQYQEIAAAFTPSVAANFSAKESIGRGNCLHGASFCQFFRTESQNYGS